MIADVGGAAAATLLGLLAGLFVRHAYSWPLWPSLMVMMLVVVVVMFFVTHRSMI